MLKKYWACLLALTTISAIQALPSVANAQNVNSDRLEVGKSNQKFQTVSQRSRSQVIVGMASWYGAEFHGKPSASGETFNKFDLTAAHPSLPFGTNLKVTNVNNGKSVVVRVNDRGPFHGGRVLDVSKAAATALDFLASGVAPVRLEVVSSPRQGV
jgi:rare lipoprotein A